MYQIIYLPIALQEYKESLVWYHERSEKVSSAFRKEVEEKLHDIQKNPTTFLNVYKHFYETHLPTYPFTIVYSIEEQKKKILIVAIYHQKRNPQKKYRL
jgi:plasmid stabilization system protein ParE